MLFRKWDKSFLFYAFHHPIYQYIKRFDLINIFSSPQEVKMLFRNNVIFTSSLLERNHEGGEFILESEKQGSKTSAPYQLIRGEQFLEKLFELKKYAIKQRKIYMFQTMIHIER